MTRTRLFRGAVQVAAGALTALGYSALFPAAAGAACLSPPGDVTNDDNTTVLDVQCSVLANLWSLGGQTGQVPDCISVPGSPAIVVDHNCDSVINVADTLLSIQFALGVALNPALDANSNQCVDACETDLDGDGTFDVLDCAPHNPAINDTTAVETCNGYDDDCNGVIDGGSASVLDSCSNDDVCDGIETCEDTPTNLGIVITEIMYNPSAVPDADGEWFELFNSGLTAVNIQGWTITDEAGEVHLIDAGGALFVPPRGYIVLGNNRDVATNGGVRVSYEYPSNFKLVNTGDTIALLDKNLSLKDRVSWSTANGFPNPTGASIALKDVRLNNELGANWMTSTASFVADPSTPVGPNVDTLPSFCADTDDLICDDGNLCTDDSCDALAGCQTQANTLPCDDGEICTTNDTCAAEACVGGPPPDCDDANGCTDDACTPGVGCESVANTDPCDDGNACTTADTCAAGGCVGGPAPNCDDGNGCTDDSCDPATGCVSVDNTAPCDDANACTTADTCAAGACVGGPAPNCDDSNVCTDDSCDPATGCVATNNSASCDDANACTTSDQCSGGSCVGGAAPDCNDGNLCTDDACDPASGCTNTPKSMSCTDDGDPCTEDVCNPATGECSIPAADGTSCDDGEQCTVPDVCQSGVCQADDFAPCFDGTSNVICVLSGTAGTQVNCPIQVAAESGASAVTLQMQLKYPSSIDLAYFTDGNKCFGVNGGPPCVPNVLTGDSGAASQLLSGHLLFVSSGNVANWVGGGEMVLIDVGNPENPLSDATYAAGVVTGDAKVLDAVFVLSQDVPADNPIYVSADPLVPGSVVTTDSLAFELDNTLFGAIIITNAP